jgi:hypothetical protein
MWSPPALVSDTAADRIAQYERREEVAYITGNYAAHDAVAKNYTLPPSLHLEIRVRSGGETLTVETGPYKYDHIRGPLLSSQQGNPHPAPVFAIELLLPEGMTVPHFKQNLMAAVNKYDNNYPLPYYFLTPITGTFSTGYNSNSYVGGMLKAATGSFYPSISNEVNRMGFLVPGYERPVPVERKQ